MRLGTRWPFGAEPPAAVPAEVRAGVRAAEEGHADAAGLFWTLTWLEGRPIVELDDGTRVGAEAPHEDEDW